MKLLLIALLALSALAADPPKPAPDEPKPVVLTPADREPAHIALEKLNGTKAQIADLKDSLPALQSAFQAEIQKLSKKCADAGMVFGPDPANAELGQCLKKAPQ